LSEYENFVSIDVKTISEFLDISELSVKRATKQLTEDNIILKIEHPTDKRRIDYFLNPDSCWRGKSLNRDKAIDKLKKKNKLQLELFTRE
jgi:predicted transcriptional regulator